MYHSKYEVGKKYAGKYHVTRVSIQEYEEPKRVWFYDGKDHNVVPEEDFAKLVGASKEVEDVPKNVPPGLESRRVALRKKYVDRYVKKEEENKIVEAHEAKKNAKTK